MFIKNKFQAAIKIHTTREHLVKKANNDSILIVELWQLSGTDFRLWLKRLRSNLFVDVYKNKNTPLQLWLVNGARSKSCLYVHAYTRFEDMGDTRGWRLRLARGSYTCASCWRNSHWPTGQSCCKWSQQGCFFSAYDKLWMLGEISGSHCGDREDSCRLGCCAV